MKGTEEGISKLKDKTKQLNLNNREKMIENVMYRLLGNSETIIKDLIFISLES